MRISRGPGAGIGRSPYQPRRPPGALCLSPRQGDRTLALRAWPERPDLGPLISAEQLERVLGYLALGQREGARVVTGGSRAEAGELTRGFFVRPTLFDAVQSSMRVAQEEIFGPVLAILTFREPEEALQLANATAYRLVAGIWTRDIDKAHGLAARLKAGQIYINNSFGGGVAAPFGGYKKSGFGRAKGLEALAHYTQVKNVCMALN